MHTNPVNKQAAMFLSKSKHVATIEEAMDAFVKKLVDGEVAKQMRLLAAGEQFPIITVTVTVKRDVKRSDMGFVASLSFNLITANESESFYALK